MLHEYRINYLQQFFCYHKSSSHPDFSSMYIKKQRRETKEIKLIIKSLNVEKMLDGLVED